MKCSELLKEFTRAGWKVQRTKGSHQIMVNPKKPGVTVVFPNHGSKEMGKGLVEKLKKQAGL